jgi:hypothetical protein
MKISPNRGNPMSNTTPYPELMTEKELILFLRIPDISKAKDYGYVIENLKRMHDLPCVHICRKPLYPLKSVLEWIEQQCEKEKSR